MNQSLLSLPATSLIDRALVECQTGNFASARRVLEHAAATLGHSSQLPARALGAYGLTLAHTRPKSVADAIAFCRVALEREPRDPQLLLWLAIVYAEAGMKRNAIRCLHRGLKIAPRHRGLLELQLQLGWRRPPVLRFLPRAHPVNVALGRLRKRLGS